LEVDARDAAGLEVVHEAPIPVEPICSTFPASPEPYTYTKGADPYGSMPYSSVGDTYDQKTAFIPQTTHKITEKSSRRKRYNLSARRWLIVLAAIAIGVAVVLGVVLGVVLSRKGDG
jgi:hypothetical protein